jgi:drug/metabolite transporter (DMT)-like permease
MTFERLRLADWVALAAALLLLFVMATDWYTTSQGEAARRAQHQLSDTPKTGEAGEDLQSVKRDAREQAEENEKNAWQASGAIDRLILLALLATAGLAVAAAFFRAAGRGFEPPWTPSALAALAALLSVLLVTYRILQEPGIDDFSTVKAGPPLALIVLGVLALGAAFAMRAEEAGTAFREPAPAPPGDEQVAAREPAPSAKRGDELGLAPWDQQER